MAAHIFFAIYPVNSKHVLHVFMSKTHVFLSTCKYRTKSKNMLQNKN